MNELKEHFSKKKLVTELNCRFELIFCITYLFMFSLIMFLQPEG